jgi:hypothetical protein
MASAQARDHPPGKTLVRAKRVVGSSTEIEAVAAES